MADSSRSHSLKRPHFQKCVEVEVNTIDNIVRSLGVKKVDFLKIDVEGAELEVLQGAADTIKRSGNLNIAVELHIGQVDFREISATLSNLGLTIKHANRDLPHRPVIYAEKTVSAQ